MFNIHTAQVSDQVLLEVKGQKVTGIITKIRPHSINWDMYLVFVTLDESVAVWDETDIRSSLCVGHNITGIKDGVTRILA